MVVAATFFALGTGLPAFAAAIVASSFNTSTLGNGDDISSAPITLGFPVAINNTTYNTVYVNNNGNVTFANGVTSFTPVALNTLSYPIVAPFFSDVDTRVSSAVTYGHGTYEGRSAFGANWINVSCYAEGMPRNSFQLILVDRSDTGTGNIDVVFNYDQIHWEAGTASGGSAGTCLGGSTARAGLFLGPSSITQYYELPGLAVAGAYLDGGPNALVANSLESTTPGRYVFRIRNDRLSITMPAATTPTAIPALGPWSMLLLSGLVSAWVYRRRLA